jgi:ATP-dependent DNA helicase RecG
MTREILSAKPVQFIKGVGPAKAKLLARLGISSVRDLLGHFPREYEDRRNILKIAGLVNGQKAVISGTIEASDIVKLNFSLSVFKVAVQDGTGIAFGLFYRKSNPYHSHDIFSTLKKTLERGKKVLLSGQVEINFGEKQLRVEDYAVDDGSTALDEFRRIVPVYPLTEGINQKWLRSLVSTALAKYAEGWGELVPEEIIRAMNLSRSAGALRVIHYPAGLPEAETARQRMALDEFLLLEAALSLSRKAHSKLSKPRSYEIKKNLLTPFRSKLGFEFTAAQKKVINEIFTDMQRVKPMNRLLLGDVGSGKTVVALSAMLLAAENGYQSALIAPTEILAEQHFLTINQILDGLGVRTALLTGRSSKAAEKRKIKESIASGAAGIIIGTHALLEEKIAFKKLAMIVIDEQHRFGVLQRAKIQAKSSKPDVLVMTATPIPRTLALTLYGDLDISVIDKIPPGRIPVSTIHYPEQAGYDMVKAQVKAGRQAYIVYPLVEESDKIELKAAVKEAENLSATVFKGYRLCLLHGQLPSQEKERIMLDFRAGKYDVMIATTVIEVGIDIPNATVMLIQHADRFGLATLHQLRGRIGRGSEKSYCVLLGEPRTPEAGARFDVMLSTSDGFKIAEEDLKLRGPGEFFGTAQHGIPPLKAADLIKDVKILEKAREIADTITGSDPGLDSPSNKSLRDELLAAYGAKFGLIKVG